MIGDNFNKKAKPQTPGGKAGGGASVFVKSMGKFFNIRSAHIPASDRWLKYGGVFGVIALLYALLFSLGGWLLPQTIGKWITLCVPLAEFVGGITPRAARISMQLGQNDFAGRIDAAVHGIAMARVLLLPGLVCMVAAVVVAVKAPPVTVFCTPQTRKNIWLMPMAACIIAAALFYVWELHAEETFGGAPVLWFDDYHRGNFAMISEVVITFILPAAIAKAASFLLSLHSVRFNLLQQMQPPSE